MGASKVKYPKQKIAYSIATSITLLTLAASAMGDSKEAPKYTAALSPLTADLRLSQQDPRFIEPTSPVVGKDLTAQIKSDTRAPDEIIESVNQGYPDLKHDLMVSAIAYLDTMKPGLDRFCEAEKTKAPVSNEKNWTEVETAAIPSEVLAEYHADYASSLAEQRARGDVSFTALESEAQDKAHAFQNVKNTCPSILKLMKLEKDGEIILPRRWVKLFKLHDSVASAEASFPRLQFSINGFTQSVYGELLSLPIERLHLILKTGYEAEIAWVNARHGGEVSERFATATENKLLLAGITPKEALLFLSYSTRNMPSLDTQYTVDPTKTFMLEVYFWKFRDLRNEVQSKYLADYFPNIVMKANPGIYHYMTAALIGCVAREAGYSKYMSSWMAWFDQYVYKVDKLFGAVKLKSVFKLGGTKKLRATAKLQGFGPGVEAGTYGGRHGTALCSKVSQTTPDEDSDDMAGPDEDQDLDQE